LSPLCFTYARRKKHAQGTLKCKELSVTLLIYITALIKDFMVLFKLCLKIEVSSCKIN